MTNLTAYRRRARWTGGAYRTWAATSTTGRRPRQRAPAACRQPKGLAEAQVTRTRCSLWHQRLENGRWRFMGGPRSSYPLKALGGVATSSPTSQGGLSAACQPITASASLQPETQRRHGRGGKDKRPGASTSIPDQALLANPSNQLESESDYYAAATSNSGGEGMAPSTQLTATGDPSAAGQRLRR